jgi:hypothetical protein
MVNIGKPASNRPFPEDAVGNIDGILRSAGFQSLIVTTRQEGHMTSIFRKSTLLSVGLLSAGLFFPVSCEQGAGAQENVALNRPYTLAPDPNYALTAPPSDRTQLTDGRYTTGGRFWTQRTTVGWNRVSPVFIAIDLGQEAPIAGASYNTAAGMAGVEFPRSIEVVVSPDGKTWRDVGDLVAASDQQNGPPPSQGYAVHRYWTDQWHARGRWVGFVVTAGGDLEFSFVDEVEVYRDPHPPAAASKEGVTGISGLLIQHGALHRMNSDLERLQNLVASAALSRDSRANLQGQLDRLKATRPAAYRAHDPETFRATLPLADWHEGLFRTQAALWSSRGVAPLDVWVPASPYDPVPYLTDAPVPATAQRSARLALMRGETRSVAVNIVNSREKPVVVQARVEGLPGGIGPDSLRLQTAGWTDTRSGTPVATALSPLPPDGWTIPAGTVGQLWMTLRAPASVVPGEYTPRIVITSSQGDRKAVPLSLTIAPMTFPERTALHLGGWDYTDGEMYSVTARNRDALVRYLKELDVDLPWASRQTLPAGRYDEAGQTLAPPDTARFDRWVERWKGASRYNVTVMVGDTFDGVRVGTDSFARKVGAWVRFWASHARSLGLQPRQLALLLVDEPNSPQKAERAIAWAEVIQQAAAGVQVWENPDWSDPRQLPSRLTKLCDVLCPQREMWLQAPDAFAAVYRSRPGTVQLGLYSVGEHSLILDPYAFYRLLAWQCFAVGATEEHFWSFSDNGSSSAWNPYTAQRVSCTPFLLEPDHVVPTKQAEAMREGMEDYETLDMLRRAVEARRRSNPQDPRLAQAEQLLSRGVQETLATASSRRALAWEEPKERTRADRVREQALRWLTESGAP